MTGPKLLKARHMIKRWRGRVRKYHLHGTVTALGLCIAWTTALPAFAATTSPANPVSVTDLFFSNVEGRNMTCVSFINISDQPIKTIEFSLSYVDVFGTPLHSVEVTREGTFSPGVLIEGPTYRPGYVTSFGEAPRKTKRDCWEENVSSPLLYTVSAFALSVTYADGTQWTSPLPPAGPATRSVNLEDLGLPSDMQKVALSRGHPCYTRFDDGSAGHTEFWYYGCASPSREVYMFVDGRLVDHSY